MPNEIPQSSALLEASPDSLSELLSRDPEGYQGQDLDRIIEALRAVRVKWQAAEAAGKERGRETTKAVPVHSASADELGL